MAEQDKTPPNQKIRVILVDDEPLANVGMRARLENYSEIEIVAECLNGRDAVKQIKAQAPDLVFLDIQMPEMIGTDFLKSLSQKPLVVFTTAYSKYALEGYELDVIDYLLKPFPFERFLKAVNKASDISKLKNKGENISVESPKNSSTEKKYILVKSEHKVHRISYDDIQYIQIMREYVAFYTPS